MTKTFSKPLFWSNVISLVVFGLVAFGVAYGWNSPIAPPVGSNGAIFVDASGNLTIGGNVSWSGFSLTGGNVPWTRITGLPADCPVGQHVVAVDGSAGYCAYPAWNYITGKPAACPAGQFVTNPATGACAAPSGGGVTGSGSAGSLAAWTGASTIGNVSGTVSFPGDINVPNLVTGATTLRTAPQAFNSSGYWGGTAGSGTANPWGPLTCPAGQIMVGIGQNIISSSFAQPYIVCAPL